MESEAVRNDALSRVAEDYLEAIYELQKATGKAATSAVARRLGVNDSSTTHMIRKLASLRLLEHTPYHGAKLMPAGQALALRAARRRDLIARYLIRFLDYSVGEAAIEADRLKHVISEKLENRLGASLGNASLDEVRSASRSSVDVIGTRHGGAAQRRERS